MPRGLAITVVVLLTAVLALGISVLYLKHQTEHQPAQEVRPITPPVAAAPTQVRLVLANDNEGSLGASTASLTLPQDSTNRPKLILQALVSKCMQQDSTHPLGPGSDINDVYMSGGNLAVVDVNTAFASGHRSGVLVEELTLASMTETLAANVPGVTRMKLLVDGKERPTLAGHADLSEPYDIAFDQGRIRGAK
jgi:hypothetical protein